MGDGVIYLVQPDEQLVRLHETEYESEDLLQRLLAQYPDILAGEQIDDKHPRRWLLISREYGVPAEDAGPNRWSIDHLFLDQDGIPTLVEVKRSTDSRIRREVVGQMLDYAANAVLRWPVATMTQIVQDRCAAEGVDPGEVLARSLGRDDQDAFWQQVKTNLEAGRVRLVFVADEVPQELRTIIDFLARQMNAAEAFGIEVKQYVGSLPSAPAEQLRSLVPRLVAGSVPMEVTPGLRGRWTRERFMQELQSAHPDLVPVAQRLVDLGTKLTSRAMEPGSGTESGSLTARMKLNGLPVALFSIYTTGELSINIGWNTRLAELGDGLSERYRLAAARHAFVVDAHAWGPGWNKIPMLDVERHFDSFAEFMSSVATEIRELAARKASSDVPPLA